MAKRIENFEETTFKGISKYLTHSDPRVRKIVKDTLEIPMTSVGVTQKRLDYLQKHYKNAGKAYEEITENPSSRKELTEAFNYLMAVGNLLTDFLIFEKIRLDQVSMEFKEQRLKDEKKSNYLILLITTIGILSIFLLELL